MSQDPAHYALVRGVLKGPPETTGNSDVKEKVNVLEEQTITTERADKGPPI